LHTDMERRPKARLGDLRGRKNKRERHNLLGVAPANQKYRLHANSPNPKVSPILAEIEILSTIFKFLKFQG